MTRGRDFVPSFPVFFLPIYACTVVPVSNS
jgi:hypothetical protein